MSLFRRGRIWHFDFLLDGVRHQGSTGFTKKCDAQDALATRRADLIRQNFGIPLKSVRFEQAIERYLKYAADNRSSYRTEKYHREQLIAHFGEIPLRAINLELCEKYKRKRLKAGVSRATINRELTTLKSILKYASKSGWAPKGLGRHAELFSGVESKLKRAVTLDELNKLLQACDSLEIRLWAPYLRDLVIVLAYSGLRPGEAIRLRWADVNLVEGSISVRKSKSAAGLRPVPMHSLVRTALQNLHGTVKSEWVFPSPKKAGEHIRDFGKAFDKAVKLSGIPRISPYFLRHTFLTWMDESGCRRSILKEIGGHSRDRHTDVYLHPDWKEKLAAIGRLPAPTVLTTPSTQAQAGNSTESAQTAQIQVERMVGPCGLEPQTSTVSR